MAIPNGSSATAITITLPHTIVLDTADIAPDTSAWYKFTTSVAGLVISSKVSNTTAEVPSVNFLAANAITPLVPGQSDNEGPLNQPVAVSTLYFIKITPDGAATAVITVDLKENPVNGAAVGSILSINSVTGLNSLITQASNGEVLRAVSLNLTQFCDINPSGVAALSIFSGGFDLIDTEDFSLITHVAVPDGGTTYEVRSDLVDKFYVARLGTSVSGKIYSLTEAGVTALKATITGGKIIVLGINVGGTKAYYTDLTAGTGWAVKVWNLLTDLPAADFAAGIVNYRFRQVLVLADDSVLVYYFNPSDSTADFVKHYTAAGAVLGSYNVTATFNSGVLLRNRDSVDDFWWISQYHPTFYYYANFRRIEFAGGTDLNNYTLNMNANGYTEPSAVKDFWIPNSFAGMFVSTVASPGPIVPTVRSGIYVVVKDKRHDTLYLTHDPVTTEDVAIPEPFAKLFYAGDEK